MYNLVISSNLNIISILKSRIKRRWKWYTFCFLSCKLLLQNGIDWSEYISLSDIKNWIYGYFGLISTASELVFFNYSVIKSTMNSTKTELTSPCMQITALDAWSRGKQLTMVFPRWNSFRFKKGHSIINLPIIIVIKAKSTDQRTQKSLFPWTLCRQKVLKKIHWSNFHFSWCGGAALGIVWI